MLKKYVVYVALILVLFITGCGPKAEPTMDPVLVVNMASTLAAQTMTAYQATADAPASQDSPAVQQPDPANPQPQSTSTPIPTVYVPPAPTNTPIPPLGGFPTPIGPWGCQWIAQKPEDYSFLKVGQEFDMVWTVRNTGTQTWVVGDTRLMYLRGVEMQAYSDVVDIPQDIKGGAAADLIVDMYAPKEPGSYAATWTLVQDYHQFCTLTIAITVYE